MSINIVLAECGLRYIEIYVYIYIYIWHHRFHLNNFTKIHSLNKMLDGWYCRTIKNQSSTDQNDGEEDLEPNVVDDSEESQDVPSQMSRPRGDYKIQYYTLKKKLKFLLYVSINI